MPKKHTPHVRLKNLRAIIGISQEKLAGLVGISYPYLLSIETGQREMSRAVSEKVFIATLVSPSWLESTVGEDDKPLDYAFRAYTKETYLSTIHPPNLVEEIDSKLLDQSSHYMRMVHALFRAAARKGKYRFVEYFYVKFHGAAQDELGLTKMFESEFKETAPPDLPSPSDQETADVMNYAVKQTLSWRAVADWKKACAGSAAERENFRRRLDDARSVVELAFDYADGKWQKGRAVTIKPYTAQQPPGVAKPIEYSTPPKPQPPRSVSQKPGNAKTKSAPRRSAPPRKP